MVKVSGLEALGVLCGSSALNTQDTDDDFDGVLGNKKLTKDNLSSLDKFTVQEKVVPLLKGIRTKEPAVMMAALDVLKCVSAIADTDFLALEVLPLMWSFSLGPLLDLTQFKGFMDAIKQASKKVEREQTKRLQDLSANPKATDLRTWDAQSSVGSPNGMSHGPGNVEQDFERLVLGRQNHQSNVLEGGFGFNSTAPTFSWSSSTAAGTPNQQSISNVLSPISRSITPDASGSIFPSLQPTRTSNTSFTNNQSAPSQWPPLSTLQDSANITRSTSNPSLATVSGIPRAATTQPSKVPQPAAEMSAFGIAPPSTPSNPWQISSPTSPTMLPPPPPSSNQTLAPATAPQYGAGLGTGPNSRRLGSQLNSTVYKTNQGQEKQGLDKYQSLL